MRCEKIIQRFNDLLDRTLPSREEQVVRAHLAHCRNCRDEFQTVKDADDILRTTVLDMLNDIEVPTNLNQRIEHALADQVKVSGGRNKFFNWLKMPALAAAVLALVLTIGYYKYYLPQQTNPSMALFNNQSQPVADEAANNVPVGNSDAASLESLPQSTPELTPPATTAAPTAEEILPTTSMNSVERPATTWKAPEAQVSGSNLAEKERESNITDLENYALKQETTTEVGAAASGGALTPMADSSPVDNDRVFSSANADLPHSGTLQEAAREVGFAPAVPDYLPPQSRLIAVTWEPGSVYQDYQAGRKSFQISQCRVGAAGVSGQGGQIIYINGAKAYLTTHNPGGGQTTGYTTLNWQLGEWTLRVEGDIPREEAIQTASSMKIK